MIKKSLAVTGLIAASLLLFLVINLVHFGFFPVRVVLYDALLDAVLSATLAILGYIAFLRPRLGLSAHEAGLSIATAFLAACLYALAVPTVIDRSLSIYILEKLEQRGGRIAFTAWEDVLKGEYFPEHRLVDIRLTEQLNSGTIRLADGCVEITPRGRAIAALTRIYRTRLLPKRREIMGQLSDDLTDPFRNSKVVVPFECTR